MNDNDTGIRASDAERDRTAEQLKRHYLDGRLTSEEYAERLDAALNARTRAALHQLLADLPPLVEPQAPPSARPWWRGVHPLAAVVALIATLWVAGWVFGGGHPHGFFPVWPLLIWGFFLFRWAPWRSRARR